MFRIQAAAAAAAATAAATLQGAPHLRSSSAWPLIHIQAEQAEHCMFQVQQEVGQGRSL